MPFLFVRPKQREIAPDVTRLATRLCPYRGAITRIELAGGQLYVSSLAELAPGRVAIPARTQRNPQTSWLELRDDGTGARFETDPLGTFPLWVVETDDFVVVTSEVKSLRAIDGFEIAFEPERWPAHRKRPPDYSPYANVRRIYPGAILHVSRTGAVREDRRTALVYRPAELITSPDEQRAELDAALLESARAIAGAGAAWGAFLSGGIDSSLATALVQRHHAELRTFTLGTEHGDEYGDAEALARHLNVPHERVFASRQDALAHFERAVFCNETIDGITAETLAQLSILASAAAAKVHRAVTPDGDARDGFASCIVTGYGADLLFGSMLRHELYMKVTGVDDLQSLIERTCWSGEFAPFYAWSLGVAVHHLFWDPRVMNCAFRIPPEASFDGTREKLVLRTLAVARGYLLESHAFRRKQALTDGTQFNCVLSSALGLEGAHAYDGKNARAISILRRVLASA
jgi:asparagine synthetase B (glutamine-hydrolysing)